MYQSAKILAFTLLQCVSITEKMKTVLGVSW